MFNPSPLDLWNEIKESEKTRDSYVDISTGMVSEFAREVLPDTVSDENEPSPENHYYEWLVTIQPQIIFNNPKARVTSRRSGVPRQASKALECGLNWWTPTVELETTGERIFVDSAFSFGVGMVTFEPMPGFRSHRDEQIVVPHRPVARRISPHRWFCDHVADTYDECRFSGHMWRRDLEDLLSDERYEKDVLKQLSADADLSQWKGKQARPGSERKEIVGYEVWVPELQTSDDPHANGTLFTLATVQAVRDDGGPTEKTASDKWIRKPRPFYGPPWGPYTLFGYQVIPGQPYPLSPFAATREQVREMNAHLTAAARSASRHKKFLMVDAAAQQTAETLRDVKDGDVVLVTGLADKGTVEQGELGGVSRDQYEYNSQLIERRDRATGLSDIARGNLSASSSASATAVADSAAMRDVRIAAMKRGFSNGMKNMMRSAAWYMFHMPTSVFPLDQAAANEFLDLPTESEANILAEQMGVDKATVQEALTPTVSYAGGPADQVVTEVPRDDGDVMYLVSANVGGIRFEDLMLEIEPYSMERVDEALLQKRTMDIANLYLTSVPLMVQFPQLPWDNFWDMVGQPLNMRDLSSQLMGDGLGAIAQMVQQQEQEQSEQQAGASQPKERTASAQQRGGEAGRAASVS